MQHRFQFAAVRNIAATVLLLAGCTVSDVKDKPAVDTAAASAASQAAATSSQTAANTLPDTLAITPGATPGAAPGSAPGAMAGASPNAGSPTGNLSPDSVDVGHHAKADTTPLSRLRLEVDVTARKLYVYDGEKRVATHSVAVGSTEWPTKTGEWKVSQVVWNPEWTPPDESWAEQKKPKQPGAPDNPLGRAQLIYDPPRTVHGTNEPASIGKAVSHGSIRLSNAVIVKLARQIMEASGAVKDNAWYRKTQQNRKEKVIVDLPQRVPIRVF